MYFAQSSKGLITGPSIANVVKQLGAKPNYNHTYLRRHFSNGAHFAQPNDELTLYEGVFRVPLGSQLVHEASGVSVKRANSILDAPLRTDGCIGPAIDTFRKLALGALKRCTGGDDNPLALELSGGIDSSSIAAFARLTFPSSKILALTNGVPCDISERASSLAYDELDYATCAAKALGLEHHVVRAGFRFHEVIENCAEVLGTFSEVAFPIFNHRIFEIAKSRGAKVLLSGFGGDELVSHHATDRLTELRNDRQFLRYAYERARAKRFFRRRRALEYKNDSLFHDVLRVPYEPFCHEKGSSVRQTSHSLTEGARSRHFAQRIETSQILAAHYGMRCEFPLADHELMKFVYTLPSAFKYRHGIGRYLIRKTIAPYLPRCVTWRQDKAGATIPAASIAFAESLPHLMQERFSPDHRGIVADYINVPVMLVKAETDAAYDTGFRLLCMQAMMLAHVDQ